MSPQIRIGSRTVGDGEPVYIIAEIGINHNGNINIAKQLMKIASDAGCQAVKFQKRTPEICVPEDQKSQMRETPWGEMTYLDYKLRTEFGVDQFSEIDEFARQLGIDWFASPWDIPSVHFLEQFDPICIKIASATLTDTNLLIEVEKLKRPVILSTGMSTIAEIESAVSHLKTIPLALAHSTSTYPCPPNELNLRMIHTLSEKFNLPIGYSGHETGLATTLAAVSIGACFIERHITLDRSTWGTDHAASVEPAGLQRLVRDIRNIELALGDGIKQVFESELPIKAKLRRR